MIQDEVAETLPDVVNLGIKITEAETAYKQAETSSDKRKAKERKEDLLRLKRVEQIYVRISIVGKSNIRPYASSERHFTFSAWMGYNFAEVTFGDRFCWI